MLPRPGLQIPPDDGWQDYALARGHANQRYDSGKGPASFPGDLSITIRNPLHRHHRPRRSVHFGRVADSALPPRNQRFRHNRLPQEAT